MPAKKTTQPTDTSTEQKIKTAARTVFHRKGFAATRTRDIAEEAGINLALLNYYFRSKEKLFQIIMLETLEAFIKTLATVFYDQNSSLEKKIEHIVVSYIDLLCLEPEVPLFIMSEIRHNPDKLLQHLHAKPMLTQSVFFAQYREAVAAGKIADLHILHFIMNILGMTVFPFVASPLLKAIGDLDNKQFIALMQQRKTLVPKWIKAMLKQQ